MPERRTGPKRTYPPEWKAFSQALRRRLGICQCTGECGDTHREYGNPDPRCSAPNHALIVRDPVEGWRWWFSCDAPVHQLTPTERKPVKVILTVAHLCSCNPLCAIEAHVKPMCQRCHLRTDRELHQQHAEETRQLMLARANAEQRALF